SAVGSVVGAAAVPALGVYGPELFPTTSRGRTNGIISAVGVVGSSAGLLAAGALSDSLGSFSPAMALLAIGPAILAVLIVVAYPETAHLELEEINPEDRVDRPRLGEGEPEPPP
ncbi:MAG: MFS transporter, partial [Acidimicrobiales bacterium]|nr:MFS transporter [Acidimicrobiales bacterium]